jgi:hypothetical protein
MTDEEFDNAVQAALDRNKAALMGRYKKELGDLLKLSDEQLSAIVPDVTKTETYNNLISVVKEASRANVAQADLQDKITTLGQGAVKIAKLVGLFA